MKGFLKLVFGLFALGGGASAAQAQVGAPPPPPPPPNPGLMTENSQVRNGGDTYDRDVQRARDEAIARERNNKGSGSRAVAAQPDDVQPGAEVRDSKGVVVGHIESVSMSAAVIITDVGKVELPLEAFGKNNKGLLISMTKVDFDKAVVEANKPH